MSHEAGMVEMSALFCEQERTGDRRDVREQVQGAAQSRQIWNAIHGLTGRYMELSAAMPEKASGRVPVSRLLDSSRYVRDTSWDQAAGNVLPKELPLKSMLTREGTPDQAAGS